jgi:hypothetical protein
MSIKKIARLLLALCSAFALICASCVTVAIAIVQPVSMRSAASVRLDLDGDSSADDVQVVSRDGLTWLDVSYSGGGSMSCSLGSASSVELVKIGAAPLTESGKSDIVALTYDTTSGRYAALVISVGDGGYVLLPMPNPDADPQYRITAAFARNYILEINNEARDFLINAKLSENDFRNLYRPDGTVPETLRAQVSRFQDFAIARTQDGYALELMQFIRANSIDNPIGVVISTIQWRGGGLKLVSQRYEAR